VTVRRHCGTLAQPNVGVATVYDGSMKLSLTGTDTWSKWLLAAPEGNTLSGVYWAITSASLWAAVIVFATDGEWAAAFFAPFAVWCASRAVAQAMRGKLLG
jgi:hypothetical protein